MRKIFAGLLMALLAASLSADPVFKDPDTSKEPEKLSDLYRFLNWHTKKALDPSVNVWPIKLLGLAKEILRAGTFFELDMSVKPFTMQGLSFEKAEFYVKRLTVDADALKHWELKVTDYREAQSRLIFTLRSLEKKINADAAARGLGEVKLRPDSSEQVIEIKGKGSLIFLPLNYEARCKVKWDEKTRQLRLQPQSLSYAGLRLPLWLSWLGSTALPQAPLLDLSAVWIPLNIQEVHVGWDQVNLSTNW